MRKFIISGSCLLLLLALAQGLAAQSKDLLSRVREIAAANKATLGFSALDLQTGKSYDFNAEQHLPMQSVYKFHLALAVLNQVDLGVLKLEQLIAIDKGDLDNDTWSPLRDKYPDGGVQIPLSEILTYTVALSDNNGCDILFKLMGGASKVNDYIKKLGIKDINIAATEREMKMYDKAQYTNWTTAHAACQLLSLFNTNTILSASTNEFLWKIMSGNERGTEKIKGQLPKGTLVAHKTGYSGVNKDGITAASNDIGIVTLPGGKKFAIAVFVTMSREPETVNQAIIAAISKAAYDFLKLK